MEPAGCTAELAAAVAAEHGAARGGQAEGWRGRAQAGRARGSLVLEADPKPVIVGTNFKH